jgi:hypothetical protein
MTQTTLRDPILSDIQPLMGRETRVNIITRLVKNEARASEAPLTAFKKVGVQVLKAMKVNVKQQNKKLISQRSRLRSTRPRSRPVTLSDAPEFPIP